MSLATAVAKDTMVRSRTGPQPGRTKYVTGARLTNLRRYSTVTVTTRFNIVQSARDKQPFVWFSASFEEEIAKASDVGWSIISLWCELDTPSINRRLAWSVRTFAIACAAAIHTPAFSTDALAEALGYPNIVSQAGQRDRLDTSDESLNDLLLFLAEYGFPRRDGVINSIDQYVSYVTKTKNDVGLKLLKPITFDASYNQRLLRMSSQTVVRFAAP